MKDYILVFVSVILLSASFMIQKLYQKITVNDPQNGVKFNIASCIFTLILFFFLGGMQVTFTAYSFWNATVKSLVGLAYTLFGFQILKRGNVALYMLFLMSGGMLVPCVWGWLFLDEPITVLRVSGVMVILVSIVLSNSNAKKPDAKLLFLCISVFLLNGMVSVLSKLHQINTAYPVADTYSYVIWGTLSSLVCSMVMQGVSAQKKKNKPTAASAKPAAFLVPFLLVLAYSAVGSIASFLQLEGAKNLPASALYPMVTGGSIALSGVFARICFKEKLSGREWLGIVLCFLGTCLFL